jgi:hypothetical protein
MSWHQHGDTKAWLGSCINNLELTIQITMKIYNKRSRPSASWQAGGCADAKAEPMSPTKILMPQGAPTVQHTMFLAMAFVSFIDLLYNDNLHKEVRAQCFLAGWWVCRC